MSNEAPEMERLPGKAASYWIESAPGPAYPSAPESLRADVAVIGGGIAGLTAAALLKQAGRTVVVIEARRIAEDVTGHTTAKITSLHHLIYHHLIDVFGRNRAQQYADANQAAIETVEALAGEHGIDCDFIRKPAYTYAQSSRGRDQVVDEVDACLRLGMPARFVDEVPLPLHTDGAIRMDGQAQFHPRKYLLGLAKTIPGGGSAIYEQTRALDITEGEPVAVKTTAGTVRADDVIVATHWPFYDRPNLLFSRMYPSASYVLGVALEEKFPEGMFISAETPSRSLRSQPDGEGELVLVSGEDHKVGQGDDTRQYYHALRRFTESIYSVREYRYRWMTQDNITVDQVPYIGRMGAENSHLYVATGFKKWGMTHGTVAGRLLSDLILRRPNPWAEVFDPGRRAITASATEFVAQGANVAAELVSGLVRSGGHHPESLGSGDGAILTVHGKKVAAYRDDAGVLVTLDPACRHMGCTVAWNPAEKTWDCPCHGSRYRADGQVIHGPAVYSLKKKELDRSPTADRNR
jgi:glycine/D-amino acid oxidase-like deaminating enzyme/nitrite reductase/ring-hydroxylating ferredoxin subunit